MAGNFHSKIQMGGLDWGTDVPSAPDFFLPDLTCRSFTRTPPTSATSPGSAILTSTSSPAKRRRRNRPTPPPPGSCGSRWIASSPTRHHGSRSSTEIHHTHLLPSRELPGVPGIRTPARPDVGPIARLATSPAKLTPGSYPTSGLLSLPGCPGRAVKGRAHARRRKRHHGRLPHIQSAPPRGPRVDGPAFTHASPMTRRRPLKEGQTRRSAGTARVPHQRSRNTHRIADTTELPQVRDTGGQPAHRDWRHIGGSARVLPHLVHHSASPSIDVVGAA
jgi:hypothetical protein